MKKIVLLLPFCFCGFLFAQNMKNDMISYVEEHYTKFLELIPVNKENLYGFENREMFNRCDVGTPIKLLVINDDNEIKITNEWRVPLSIDGKYITLITVIEDDKNYHIVDIGGSYLAKRIDSYNRNNEKISFMLRDYRNKTDYVSFEYNSRSDKNFYKIQESDTAIKGISLNEIIETQNINK